MPNTNEYLKQLTANDDQQTFSDKSNYNFAKLLDLSGATNTGGDYTLLPGTKGDTGDIGNRGNYIYSKDDPATILPTDLIDGDINISALTAIISQYEDGTLPIWNNIINIKALIADEISNLPPGVGGGALVRLLPTYDQIVTFKGTLSYPYDASKDETLFLNDFDILNNYPSFISDLENGILSIYRDNSKGRYNVLIGSTDGVKLSTVSDSLKIKYESATDKATANFDLTGSSGTTNTGFVFKTNDKDNNNQIITTIGGKSFIGDDISGINISSNSRFLRIGIVDIDNSKIFTNTPNLIFTSNLIPIQNAKYSIGSSISKIKDFYLSGNIESDNIFIGEIATIALPYRGIHYKSGKVGINTLVDNYKSALTIKGDLEFALNSHNLVYIKTQESKSAYDHSGGGMALHINAGKGGDVGPPPPGIPPKPSATHGGDITISGGAGGESTQFGVTGGKGGNVHIYGGNGGNGNPNGADGNIIIGNEKRGKVTVNSNLDINVATDFSVIETRSANGSDGQNIIYNIIENNGTFNINEIDAVDGRVIVIKDATGNAGTSPLIIKSSHKIDFSPAIGGILDNTITINKNYGYIWLVFKSGAFYTISHYGIII